jgi:hypothetical protein
MKALAIVALALGAVFATQAYAQDPPADTMQIVREKIKADKKLFVAENMELTESEAKGFWPVYESYQQDLAKINQRMGKAIKDYAANYKTMTDEVADKLVTEASAIEVDRTAQIQSYLPKLKKVLPGKKVARYYQLESKIRALINFELAANIPLVQ